MCKLPVEISGAFLFYTEEKLSLIILRFMHNKNKDNS